MHFLTSILGRGEWLVPRPGRFTPGERILCTHSIGEWVGPTASLDAVARKTKSINCPAGN